ncbi:RnfG Predicted NADH,ubiquinone oxidoreductase, subunit RnfG [Methylophilaceae bacterium]
MRLTEIKSALFRNALRTAAIMLAFAFIGTLLLATMFDVTRAPIEASEKAARLSLFKEILPAQNYDNDLLASQVTIAPNALLGNRLPSIANVAKKQQQTAGIILEAIAHDGYSGDIKLLIAIRADGSISGVRVLAHKETPGLGDYIDIAHGNWIKLFDNESLQKTPLEKWQVKKDGGQYDYMVGATITPRAVVKAVRQTLQFYQQNKQTLFAVNP